MTIPSARDLVAKYIGRYRQMDFGPDFPMQTDFSVLVLFPFWRGELRSCTLADAPCSVDLRSGDIRFSMEYLGNEDRQGILNLGTTHAWMAAQKKFLEDRRIVAEPEFPFDNPGKNERVRVRFSLEDKAGKKIKPPKGLDLSRSTITAPWEFFIPEGTPEHQAIRAAIDYEGAKNSPELEDRPLLGAKLLQVLELVPT